MGLPSSCHPFAALVDLDLFVVVEVSARTGPREALEMLVHMGSCCVDHLLGEMFEVGQALQVSSAEEASCHRNSVQVEGHHNSAVVVAVGSTDHWDSSSHLESNRKCFSKKKLDRR